MHGNILPMRKATLANFILLFALFTSCEKQTGIRQLEDGIIVTLDEQTAQAKQIKLQVVSDNIIHVTASPADTFSSAKSLMIVPELKNTGKWKLEESPDKVSLITNSLQVNVSLSTGEIIFTDTSGTVILKELTGGGKTFAKKTLDNQKSYEIRQVFESPDDEAFYGLGGHQNGQMNYKGEDVKLVQHNIVDVVPFLYSTKNYGILWDNYSISKFGDPRDYQPLNSLQLFSKDGKPAGLSADYYVDNKIVKTAIEDKIEFEFLETPQVDNFPKEVAQNGRVVWQGSFSSDVEGAHKYRRGVNPETPTMNSTLAMKRRINKPS